MVKSRTRDIVLVGLFSALIAAGAFVKIPNPIGGLMPITLQTAFVILAGLVLSPSKSFLSILIYIIMGLSGLPIFSLGGGPSYVLVPSFGFLVGFAVATPLTSYIYRLSKKRSINAAIVAGLIGTATYYIIGLPYLYLMATLYLGKTLSAYYVFVSCFLVFLPGDLLTMIMAALGAKHLKPFML